MNEPNFNKEEGDATPNMYEPPEGYSPPSEAQLEVLTKHYQQLYQETPREESMPAETEPVSTEAMEPLVETVPDPSIRVEKGEDGDMAVAAFMEATPEAVESAVESATGEVGLEKVESSEMPTVDFAEVPSVEHPESGPVAEEGAVATPAEAVAHETGSETVSEGVVSPTPETEATEGSRAESGVGASVPPTEGADMPPRAPIEYSTGFFARAREKFQNAIDRLPTSAKRLVEGLYATAKFHTIDRLRISANQRLLDWHDGFAEKYASQIRSYDAEIESLKNIGSSEIARRYGITNLPGFAEAQARQQQGNARRIEELEHKREVAQNKLKRRNNKKATYENARDDIARGYEGKVSEQLQPLEARMETLTSQKEQYDTEIGALAEKHAEYEKKITQMEKDLSEGNFYKHERELLKQILKEARNEYDLTKDLIKERLKARAKVEKRMVPVESKMDTWRARKNVAARITNREANYQDVGERRGVEFDDERTAISTENPSPGVSESESSTAESVEALTTKNLEQRWNTYFASSLPLRTRVLEQVLTAGSHNEDEALTPDVIVEILNGYAAALRKLGHDDAPRFWTKDGSKTEVFKRAARSFVSFNRK